VKESLFNILGTTVHDKNVLDLFAGTGNLGLEALSRGAAKAAFIDQATERLIQDNAEHTHLAAQTRILRGDVFQQLRRLEAGGSKFDMVFCDPPYHKGLWEKTLFQLDGGGLLQPGAYVIVECGRDEADITGLSKLAMVRNPVYGRTTQIRIYQEKSGGGVP
jgi:16S rRNA (guanine(966)-N(2))-methyltransferase RsmD